MCLTFSKIKEALRLEQRVRKGQWPEMSSDQWPGDSSHEVLQPTARSSDFTLNEKTGFWRVWIKWVDGIS